jgi:hypothetical protein
MTPEQHTKYLTWAHLGYAGLHLLMFLAGLLFMSFVLMQDPVGPPPVFLAFMAVFFIVMASAFTLPSLFAAYGLRKKKTWARTAGICAAVVAAMNAPIGTAVCIYTLWFLFTGPGKDLNETSTKALPPARPWWVENEANARERQPDYSKRTPPDWR